MHLRTKGIVEFIPDCMPIEEIKNQQIDMGKNPREALIDHFQRLSSIFRSSHNHSFEEMILKSMKSIGFLWKKVSSWKWPLFISWAWVNYCDPPLLLFINEETTTEEIGL